jgi:DNA invertase Pin-like site-specific DNA recombinase
MKKAVIYGRVSTTKQDFDRQVFELEKFAKQSKLQVVKVFAEKVTGTKKGKDRTEFERMREYVEKTV